MTLKVVSRDLTSLPAALLAQAKQHLRIDGSYDDAFVESIIARAIGRFEQVNEVTINPTEVLWTVKQTDFVDGAATAPVRPATISTIEEGEPPVDVSSDYQLVLKWNSIHGIPIEVLQGPAGALSATLTCGFATAADLPPPVLDVVFRYAAHLYEHREILIPGTEFVAPDLAMDATWWAPRV